MRDRADVLEELIRWIGDCLERLEKHAGDEERVRGTLRALKHACRPATNPKLKAAIEDPAEKVKAGVRRALEQGWRRQQRRGTP